MVVAPRRTVVVHGRLAMRELRLNAAREGRHGLQIMTFEQLAARLAGGLTRPVDDETLRAAIQTTLPETALGELDAIKGFPGMVSAAVDTLRKAWRAGVDLQTRADNHPRLRSIAALEAAVPSRRGRCRAPPLADPDEQISRIRFLTCQFRLRGRTTYERAGPAAAGAGRGLPPSGPR